MKTAKSTTARRPRAAKAEPTPIAVAPADQAEPVEVRYLMGKYIDCVAQDPEHFHDGLDERDFRDLETLLQILQNERGVSTPIECFIRRLVRNFGYRDGAITPDDVIAEIEGEDGFRRDFEDALREAKTMYQRFPELVTAPEAAAAKTEADAA